MSDFKSKTAFLVVQAILVTILTLGYLIGCCWALGHYWKHIW